MLLRPNLGRFCPLWLSWVVPLVSKRFMRKTAAAAPAVADVVASAPRHMHAALLPNPSAHLCLALVLCKAPTPS